MKFLKYTLTMRLADLHRIKSSNRCRICGQFIENKELYYFIILNGTDLKKDLEKLYKKISNILVHKYCIEKIPGTEIEKIKEIFKSDIPKCNNKLSEKQQKFVDVIKRNCKKYCFKYHTGTKYIHISGVYTTIEGYKYNIAGKYNIITTEFTVYKKCTDYVLNKSVLEGLIYE
jgi:hypothetical protein